MATKSEDPDNVGSSSSSESGTDDERHDTLQQEHQDGEGYTNRSRQSRNEKKARKAVLRQGMKPMPEIVKVIIRKAKQAWFVVEKPDVYKSLTSDTYIIFGHAESMASQAHSEAAQRFTQGAMPFGAQDPASSTPGAVSAVAKALAAPVAESSEDVAMYGVNPKDVQIIVSQIKCSTAQAVDALRANDNDLVEAILHLTGC